MPCNRLAICSGGTMPSPNSRPIIIEMQNGQSILLSDTPLPSTSCWSRFTAKWRKQMSLPTKRGASCRSVLFRTELKMSPILLKSLQKKLQICFSLRKDVIVSLKRQHWQPTCNTSVLPLTSGCSVGGVRWSRMWRSSMWGPSQASVADEASAGEVCRPGLCSPALIAELWTDCM